MKKLTTEQWINKAKEIHGDKYNYSITMYSTAKTKLKIICSEHGEQHFKAITYWGGLEGFKKLIIKDDIKNRFCAKNNLSLLRISYKENINKKLGENIIIKNKV